METINAYLWEAFRRFADLPMQIDRDRRWTYAESARCVHGVAAFLKERGVAPGERVALVAENSPRWLHACLGILAAGAVVVPRGEDIADDELAYIVAHSEARLAFAGSARTEERLGGSVPVVRVDGDAFPTPLPLAGEGRESYAGSVAPDDLAVLLYTSGTTGRPKGVMLEHGNVAHNLRTLPPLVNMQPGDAWVSILPSWHTFEMTVELCGFSIGCTTIYSDKRRVKEDLAAHRPQFFASVPRIWESIHDAAHAAVRKKPGLVRALFRWALASSRRRGGLGHAVGKKLFYGKIAAATGGRLKAAVSGGGYLPPHVDEFFAAVGVPLLVGYGLTETAPVVALRDPADNRLGTIGRAVPETEIRVGPAGTFLVRGPQVMRGYYKEEELTSGVLDADGWFDTGDLGRITEDGDLVFVGRAKETIVLSGGENVEPEPIENRLLQSPLLDQVMVVGQDRKTLGALIVPNPEARPTEAQVRELLAAHTGPAGGFRAIETIHRFALLDEPFTPENGQLTQTLKKRRNVIAQNHAPTIAALYDLTVR